MAMETSPAKNIDDYIAQCPAEVQAILQELRETIRKAAPEAQETISYMMPTFTLEGNLVHFAAFKNHIGFYPAPSGIEQFRNELSTYELSKGTIRFPLGQPIPLELVSRIVKLRVQENLEKAEAKKNKLKAKTKKS
ncbi:MAG TPA: DUF1801 domain-containing protein [Prolixibacteraceae bacterium]|nr:DUF1801 domain-containing protein [Prolixibacteraceae bacterium]